MSLLGYPPATLAWIGAASLLAFVVRGVSGFGSSMIGIGALTMVLPPAQVVPAFMAIELLTATNLLPRVWRDIDWRSLRWVIAGCALATPLGVALLGHVPADPMRGVVSACLLLIALFMLSAQSDRLARAAPRGNAAAFAVGCSSGLLNGAAGIGGPPAVVFYFTAHAAGVGRASLIAYFVFTDISSLAWAGVGGLLHGAAWSLVAVALPFSLLGVWIGSRFYLTLGEAELRRWIWRLLAVLGAVGLASAAWRLFIPTIWPGGGPRSASITLSHSIGPKPPAIDRSLQRDPRPNRRAFAGKQRVYALEPLRRQALSRL